MSLMRPIKTSHQSLQRGLDTETDELDIVRGNYSTCVSDLKSRGSLFVIEIHG